MRLDLADDPDDLRDTFANKVESDGYATFASITVVSARTRFVFDTFASAPGSTTPRSAR